MTHQPVTARLYNWQS